jgi:hypothetical protein
MNWSPEESLRVLPLSQVLEIAHAMSLGCYDVRVSEYDSDDEAACATDEERITITPGGMLRSWAP